MVPVRGYKGARVAVLGLGRSGLATARALRAGGAETLLWDDDAGAREAAGAEGGTLHDLSKGNIWGGVAALIVSPGIPHLYPSPHPAVAAAREAGVPTDNDIGLFFRAVVDGDMSAAPPRVIAVTGSNGKSTTAALIHHLLLAAGRPSRLAGNIGRAVLDLDLPGEGEIIVLELSSYQIELARSLAPDIAVLTNLTPDHLDRHGGLGGYFAAKRRLFAEGGPERAVIGVDEAEGVFLADQMSEQAGDDRVIRISAGRRLSGPGWSVFARKGFLAEYRKGRQVASVDLRGLDGLPGAHNHQNACAAYAACRAVGVSPRVAEQGFRTFQGLPHRSQIVARRGGVTFVNDSKATNAESAAQALQAFGRIRWIAGGLGKEGGIGAVMPHLGSVVKAYLIGDSAQAFAAALGHDTPHEICGTMARAVARAVAEAEAGETVLLAPAAASFDQYPDFEQRGAAFMAEVARLSGE